MVVANINAVCSCDYDFLYEHGAVAIFAPGTNIPEAGMKLLKLLMDRAKEEAS